MVNDTRAVRLCLTRPLHGPVGSANLTDQIHDYNPHVDSEDVFWTVPVPQREVTVDFEDTIARLRVRRLTVFDDHDLANSLTSGLGLPGDLGFSFPKISPVAPVRATVSFDIGWSSNLGEAKIHNASQGFQGSFRAKYCCDELVRSAGRLPLRVGCGKYINQRIRGDRN